ncbi:hypothetical protein JCM33374_g3836 [Metschnikowia sp. JCM 33374]|nr:hypothetical protein JCM33374_g3836 [Metschnikowia sp. JCM 33374]
MRVLLLSYCASVLGIAAAIPVDVDPKATETDAVVTVGPSKPSALSVPKLVFADILDEDGDNNNNDGIIGFNNITLLDIPHPPPTLFNFSKDDNRDYSVDKKFVNFFHQVQELATPQGFDTVKFSGEADQLKELHSSLKDLVIKSTKNNNAPPFGVVELFNTTAYYYKLIRYYQELIEKDKKLEFDEYDIKCVRHLIKQLNFEISLAGFLGFDGYIKLNSTGGDPRERVKEVQKKQHELELELGQLFMERSQVFEFNIREFARQKELVKTLTTFVRENSPATQGKRHVAAIEAMSLKDEPYYSGRSFEEEVGLSQMSTEELVVLWQNFDQVETFSKKLNDLLERANKIDLASLKEDIDDINIEFEELNLHYVRWGKFVTPEVLSMYYTLEKLLGKLDELDDFYYARKEREGYDDHVVFARFARSVPSFVDPNRSEDRI